MCMPSQAQVLPASDRSVTEVTLVDAWYAEALKAFGARGLDDAIAERFPMRWVRWSQRWSLLRGLLGFLVSRHAKRIVFPFSARGLPTLLALHWLLSARPPRLYLVEFLRGEPNGWLARFKEALHVALFATLLPRLLAGAQVMTPWEAMAYARKYRLPLERFQFIAFPMVRDPSPSVPEPAALPRHVLSSGRAACDWPTLINAARGATWPLTIVCSAEDRAAVDALNHDGRATVLSEVTHEEHQRLLASAEVYALVLREQRASSGQVRMARAIEAGVPVVASRVQGLEGYLDAGTTALAVPAGDTAALRAAIDRLLQDAPLRDTLRHRAHAAVQARSLDAYVDRIRAFVFEPPEARIRVAYCGPIGAIGQPAGGGYESANRRNCDALTRRGVVVTELPYPKVTTRPLVKLWRYGTNFVRTAAFLIARRKDYDLLHLTPLNMHFALVESWLVACARWLGKPVLLDIRAGTFVRHHEGGSALYRRTIDRTLRLASHVAVEGEAYLPFVRKRSSAPVLHFPNYVDGPALRQTPAVQTLDRNAPVRLLYFGRLVAEKGIETTLATLVILQERGHAVELELIGDGPAAFVAGLRQRHALSPVTWSAGLPVAAILQRAAAAHFFVFASRHDGEGHSNALNEAMSVGLVPVCSDQGFTRSVVGDAGVVLPVESQASEYAAAIEAILLTGRWATLSQRARLRVRTLYSEDATLPPLIDTYRRLLKPRAATAEPRVRS